MIQDAHDKRPFRQWVTLNADGTIAAVHEIEAGVEAVGKVEVTNLYPADLRAVKVDPKALDLQAAITAQVTINKTALALDVAAMV